jgi:hypothetical protein
MMRCTPFNYSIYVVDVVFDLELMLAPMLAQPQPYTDRYQPKPRPKPQRALNINPNTTLTDSPTTTRP